MATPIDLRSDTVTRPSPAMRRAMAEAEVGDDVYGEDPTARRLEERTAELLGKEAALFVPSGTMANQIALQLLGRLGDEVIVGEGAHLFFYEIGAAAALAGVQCVEVGKGGLFTRDDLEVAIKPDLDYLARTGVVALENTHNRAGGRVFPQEDVTAIAELAHARGMGVHLDGARLFHASLASGRSLAELAAPVDTVSVCFSKGLGAPVGSALASTRAHIAAARRIRRRLGGSMRQVGILCAAGLYALEHNRERLVEDHAHARLLGEGLADAPGLACDLETLETNIVSFEVTSGDAASFVARAAEEGVLVNATGLRRLRAVTHLDVTKEDVTRAVSGLARAARA